LVEFLHHGNTQIRQIAAKSLVSYSHGTQSSIFKTNQLTPVKDLKLLVKDYAPIAENTLTILINISTDPEILRSLAEDDAFLESVLARVTNPKEPNANLLSMLLANLAKSDSLSRLLNLKRPAVPSLSSANTALDQLLDLFNAGVHGKYNPLATYEYLVYVFADLAKFPTIATHLTSAPTPPLTLLLPHLSPSSPLLLRLATASCIRNTLLALPTPTSTIPTLLPLLLPALLRPLIGPDPPFTDEETALLPEELQYLGPEQKRETDVRVLEQVVESLYLLVGRGGEEGKKGVKEGGSYAVLRELHLWVEDDGVRGCVERVVDVLMTEEGDETILGKMREGEDGRVVEVGEERGGRSGRGTMVREEDSEDEKVVDVF
ncbi:MAG: hypothetical protein Q9184_007664, partial [Pyrenodesmia sp. 2 TL-2023]